MNIGGHTQMAKSSTSTGEYDPVTDVCAAVLECAVDRHALQCYLVGCGPDRTMTLTAHRMDAASALSIPSGIGVTWLTYET